MEDKYFNLLKCIYFKDIVSFSINYTKFESFVLDIRINHNKFDLNSDKFDSYYASIINNFTLTDLKRVIDFFKSDSSVFEHVIINYSHENTEILDEITNSINKIYNSVHYTFESILPYPTFLIASTQNYCDIFSTLEENNIDWAEYIISKSHELKSKL